MDSNLVLPKKLNKVLLYLRNKSARSFLVGGVVRDALLGMESKDIDIEVYGIGSLKKLEALLGAFGKVSLVGKSFGVVKLYLDSKWYDFGVPRIESKVGKGHRGFRVKMPQFISLRQALNRRDYTINAIAYDPFLHRYFDPFGGMEDLKRNRLRHIDAKSFSEDPLRVYRAVQFAARFELCIDEQTALLCKKMVSSGMLDELAKERIFEEIKKLLLKSQKPSIGFELMREWGIIERYFPELHALISCSQDPTHHPEGDVWTHTMIALDAMAKICHEECKDKSEKKRLTLMLAALCHDLGKPDTATVEKRADGSVCIRAIGHEVVGVEVAERFLLRLTFDQTIIKGVISLVRHHLAPMQLFRSGAKSGAVRRLSTKVKIDDLVLLAKADFLGRGTKEAKRGVFEAGKWLLECAKKLGVDKEPLKPLVKGRDLLALGLEPSPRIGRVLQKIYDAQLKGRITTFDEALLYAKRLIRKG